MTLEITPEDIERRRKQMMDAAMKHKQNAIDSVLGDAGITPKNTTPGHVEPLTQPYAITFKDSDETITVEIVDYEIKDGFLSLFRSEKIHDCDYAWVRFASYAADNIKQIVKQQEFTEAEALAQMTEGLGDVDRIVESSEQDFLARRHKYERAFEDILIAIAKEKTPDGLRILGRDSSALIAEFNRSMDSLQGTHKAYDDNTLTPILRPGDKRNEE